ncbi:hypothetical protein PRIPAC_80763 [Pristionchus pacificus]|uniref:Galectin n=1 Tax=Pristionchus pacificus TaxID=54126 RepID=A0A2A6BHA6_PRIPA|nr:hypothetical protein PRIPAC_80763 [Pristionchus pacificus]|eukprot:PDM65274.1 hypothetical protein PRIPAC_52216 [Pristionchus pacificus]
MEPRLVVFLALLCGATALVVSYPPGYRNRQNTVANQKIVFRRKLADEIKTGHSIVIEGTVEDEANRFDILLRTDKTVVDFEVPLLLSFRLQEKFVVMKSNFNGGWDVDQRRRSPINAGDDMKIEIIVGDDEYLIIVNDTWKARYLNRVDPVNLSLVTVTGDVFVDKIEEYTPEEEEGEGEEEEDGEEGGENQEEEDDKKKDEKEDDDHEGQRDKE